MPSHSMGACLVSNDLPGLGKQIIDMRVQGRSWKDIGDDLGLGSPSTARKTFTKITGISDYKTKGQAIRSIAKQIGFLDDAGEVAANFAVKSVQAAIKKPGAGVKGQVIGKGEKANAAMKEKFGKVSKEALDDQRNVLINAYGPDDVAKVRLQASQGKGYTAIAQDTGLPIPDIDRIVWQKTLEDHGGDVWKAYESKATSKTGGDAVKNLVHEAKKASLTDAQIADATGIPKTVVQAIQSDTWSIPTSAGAKPIIPDPPPQPPKTSILQQDVGQQGYDFQLASHREMSDWARSLGNDLSSGEMNSIRSYTGSGYHTINNSLRTGRSTQHLRNLDSAMRPVPTDIMVIRNTGADTFRSMGISGPSEAHELLGKVFKDPGYLSTAVEREQGTFSHQAFRLRIQVPKGTPGRYVDAGLSANPGERELILARDRSMLVTKVSDEPGSRGRRVIIDVEIV